MPLRFAKKLRAFDDLVKLVSGHPDFSDFYLQEVLKASPDQVTAVGLLDGRKVILKRSLQPDAGAQVLRAKQELDRATMALERGPHRVNTCVAAFPDLGLIALEFVPGQRLDRVISAADANERARLLTLAGGWLKSYTAPRSATVSHFTPRWWIKAVTPLRADLHGRDLELFEGVLDGLKARAKSLRGTDVTKAPTHGDFVSINAIYRDGTIYGVDIQGLADFPVALDVARFLVWTQTHTPSATPGARFLCGVAEGDAHAFLDSGVLPDSELQQLLPFFVGQQIAARMCVFRDEGAPMTRLRDMAMQFIAQSNAH